ncbi:MAG: hypothetical protein ACYS5V_11805 [Planctomycetota bacterium]|jgi:hypothetical protein
MILSPRGLRISDPGHLGAHARLSNPMVEIVEHFSATLKGYLQKIPPYTPARGPGRASPLPSGPFRV